MKKRLQWFFILMTAVLAAAFVPAAAFPSTAEETAAALDETDVHNGWINENLGPGVARWVDEDGTVSKQPGKKEETSEAQDQQEDTEPFAKERQIDPAQPMVALTFDDGPYAPVGNEIMDSLARYGGKATFFVVGRRAPAYKTELQRMVAEGHEIGNHTFDHKYLTKLSKAQIQSQIDRCSDAVFAAAGVRPALVRLPGGLKNQTVLENVKAPMIMWSIDTLDWKTRNAEKTVRSVMSQVRDGDIVLMHELYPESGAAALEIIPQLAAAGYQMVTVSEMAKYRGGVVPGGVYSRFSR